MLTDEDRIELILEIILPDRRFMDLVPRKHRDGVSAVVNLGGTKCNLEHIRQDAGIVDLDTHSVRKTSAAWRIITRLWGGRCRGLRQPPATQWRGCGAGTGSRIKNTVLYSSVLPSSSPLVSRRPYCNKSDRAEARSSNTKSPLHVHIRQRAHLVSLLYKHAARA